MGFQRTLNAFWEWVNDKVYTEYTCGKELPAQRKILSFLNAYLCIFRWFYAVLIAFGVQHDQIYLSKRFYYSKKSFQIFIVRKKVVRKKVVKLILRKKKWLDFTSFTTFLWLECNTEIGLQKVAQTRTHADRSGRSGAALGPCSGQPKRRYQSQIPPKPSLKPAKIPVKEHLRLASVVALSSSGACGAIIQSTI